MCNDESRNIPDPIKRAVRQKCGFGCVICGDPFIEYHHIVPWATVKKHEIDNLVLLCYKHHRQVGNKLFPAAELEKRINEPYCISHEFSSASSLTFNGPSFSVNVGSNSYTALANKCDDEDDCPHYPLMIDSVPLVDIRFQGDHILISIRVWDKNHSQIFEMRNNEIKQSATAWDIEWAANTVVIREKLYGILLDITFQPNQHEMTINRGNLSLNAIQLQITHDEVKVNNINATLAGNNFTDCQVGVHIGDLPGAIGAAFHMPVANRIETMPRIVALF